MKMIIWVLLSSACLCFSCNVKTFESSSTEGSSADGGNHKSGSSTPVLTADDFKTTTTIIPHRRPFIIGKPKMGNICVSWP